MDDKKRPLILGPDSMPLSDAETGQAEAGFELATDFNLKTLTGRVKVRIPGTDQAVWMLPAEARMLGMRFIAIAQEAIDMCAFIRFAVEAGEMPPGEAAQAWQLYSLSVRQAHAKQYALYLNQQDRADAMDQPPAGKVS